MDDNSYLCYIIENNRSTYVGITNNKVKRLRQHNCEISGGAKYTSLRGPWWRYVCIINNLDKRLAMQLEWAIKHEQPIKASGILNRIKKVVNVLKKDRFTSKSKQMSELFLHIEWYGTHLEAENALCLNMLENLNKSNVSYTII